MTAKVCWALIGEGNPRIPIHSHVEVIKTMDYEVLLNMGDLTISSRWLMTAEFVYFMQGGFKNMIQISNSVFTCQLMSTWKLQTLQNHVNVETQDTAKQIIDSIYSTLPVISRK